MLHKTPRYDFKMNKWSKFQEVNNLVSPFIVEKPHKQNHFNIKQTAADLLLSISNLIHFY